MRNLEIFGVGEGYSDGTDEVLLVATCPKCENEPRYVLSHKRFDYHFYSMCRSCESIRQQFTRTQFRVLVQRIEEQGLQPQVVKALEANGFNQMVDLIRDPEWAAIKGVGPKTVEFLTNKLAEIDVKIEQGAERSEEE